jgi:hypothetical protein
LNLIITNGVKVIGTLDEYLSSEEENEFYKINLFNLISHSWNYFSSKIDGFYGENKNDKVEDHFANFPICAIICGGIFLILVLAFLYLIKQLYILEINFLERLINFNTPSFENYLKKLEELKKKMRNDNNEEDDKIIDEIDLNESKKNSEKQENLKTTENT